MSLFAELKRRNVFRVAVAYGLVGWLIMQVGEVMAPALNLPDWINSALAFFLILGFPVALFFAWVYELTPEGIRKEKEVDRTTSVTQLTGRKLDFVIIGLLLMAVAYFAWDRFVVPPADVAAEKRTASDATVAEPTPAPEVNDGPDTSIAVLPFVNMSGDATNEYFSDGISEEILNLLAKIPELKVTSRSSAFSFKGQQADIPTVARQLGVAHVLEGSVRKAGNRVRVTAQLIKADDDVHLWSETFDRELDDVFAIQDEIAAEVTEALQLELLGDLPHATPTDADAYALYLQGRHFASLSTRESRSRAEELYRQAIDVAPGFAPAWAGLARTQRNQANMSELDLAEGTEAARAAAIRAIEIDSTLAEAWAELARLQFNYDWAWDRSQGTIRTALMHGPRNPDVLTVAAVIERGLGQPAKAVTLVEKAVEVDPLDRSVLRSLAVNYFFARRYADTERVLRQILDLYPEQEDETAFLAIIVAWRGAPEDALQYLDETQDNFWHRLAIATVNAKLGRMDTANRTLEALIERWGEGGSLQYAELYAQWGQPDEAFAWLDRAVEIRDGGIGQILVSPALDSIHGDPRWEQLLNQVGLLPYWRAMQAEDGELGP